jgi:hypothetical protein
MIKTGAGVSLYLIMKLKQKCHGLQAFQLHGYSRLTKMLQVQLQNVFSARFITLINELNDILNCISTGNTVSSDELMLFTRKSCLGTK